MSVEIDLKKLTHQHNEFLRLFYSGQLYRYDKLEFAAEEIYHDRECAGLVRGLVQDLMKQGLIRGRLRSNRFRETDKGEEYYRENLLE